MLPPACWAMAAVARSDAVSDAKTIPDRRMDISPCLLARLKPRFQDSSVSRPQGYRELEKKGWYSWVGSNHRPPDPQSGALTN